MRHLFPLTLATASLIGCSTLPPAATPLVECVEAVIASPATTDFRSAGTVALSTPACRALSADLLQQALITALARKAR